MNLLDIKHDGVVVELEPLDCQRLALACSAATYDIGGHAIPDRFFGVEGGTTAGLHLGAFYGALAAFFETAMYAGEADYFPDTTDRRDLNLIALERRYGGGRRQADGG